MNDDDMKRRRLPEGIQSFEMIRRGDYLYVDKTDLVWQLANSGMFKYLSRPRHFGKSLLVDTLACYFEGKRDLFEGLRIMGLEKEWKKYPVLRFDMSEAGATEAEVKSFFNNRFREWEKTRGIDAQPDDSLVHQFCGQLRWRHAIPRQGARHRRAISFTSSTPSWLSSPAT